jgi:hypothetical protein
VRAALIAAILAVGAIVAYLLLRPPPSDPLGRLIDGIISDPTRFSPAKVALPHGISAAKKSGLASVGGYANDGIDKIQGLF